MDEDTSFNNFIGSVTFVGLNRGQSYVATLVTPQKCTKFLQILLLLNILHIWAMQTKSSFLFFQATFEQLFEKLLEAFWKLNLEQLMESPRGGCAQVPSLYRHSVYSGHHSF